MPRYLDVPAPEHGVQLITLQRPEALNALCTELLAELAAALEAAGQDEQTRAVVITGSRKAFAAGADIREMAERDLVGILNDPRVAHWQSIAAFAKPLIAAVNGYALGGGCELVMCADIVIAGSDARFGQPEINLGIIPGFGGTQRLTHAVGKSVAMEMVLTGRTLSAEEARSYGLVNHVYPVEVYFAEAVKLAVRIAAQAPIAARLAKEAVNKSFEMSLQEGLNYERRLFHMLFASEDQKEGMAAFIEKRKPNWTGK